MILTDYETTGLIKADAVDLNLQPFITEIYALKLTKDLEFVDEFETFIKPPIPISEEITKLTGIDDAMLVDAPSFISVYPKLVEIYLGEAEVVAHNVSFEIGMLNLELRRCGYENKFPWPHIHTCTVEKSMPIKNRYLKLGQLHELATGRPHEGGHRAKADVLALAECYAWLKEKGLV